MSNLPDALCLSASPALQLFDRPLLQHLANHVTIAHWEYHQTLDEPSSLDVALVLLHDYLTQHVGEASSQGIRPIHLIGHGISGLLALLYTQRYPERVQSLTLLAVGIYPAVDWQAHYYTQRQQLSCSRQRILIQMVQTLFGNSSKPMTKALVKILEQDLDNSLSPHSLLKVLSLPPIQVSRPLFVCGSVDDVVIDPHQLRSWQSYFGEETIARLWACSGGRHFFHYFYPEQTGDEILQFWQSFSSPPSSLTVEEPLSSMLELSTTAVD
jgi:surfactin synthase thioesterase subunit